jgi:hypothetical protein
MNAEWIRTVIDTARPWSGVISVVGGLLMFLSWTVNNMLRERFSKLKTSIESAHSEQGLTNDLAEVKDMIYNLNSEMIELLPMEGKHPSMFWEAYSGVQYIWRDLHGLRRLGRLAEHSLNLSKSSQDNTKLHQELKGLASEVIELAKTTEEQRSGVDAMLRQTSYGNEEEKTKEAITAYKQFEQFLKDSVWDVVRPKTAELSELTARRSLEIERQLKKAKRRAKSSGVCHIMLYFVGGILLLFGQFIEKAVK